MERDQLLAVLEEKYPKAWFKTSEDFDGHKGGIYSGEGSDVTVTVEGDSFEISLFDHWADDFKETTYIMGVYKPLFLFLESVGWYAEFYDAGTVVISN